MAICPTALLFVRNEKRHRKKRMCLWKKPAGECNKYTMSGLAGWHTPALATARRRARPAAI